jgi:hypothetical protein
LQVKREGMKEGWTMSQPNLPQPYRNPLGYAASMSSSASL